MSIGTVLIFLLFGSLMEYDTMKMRSLRFFGGLVALSFLLFGFCFSPSAVYLASILAVLSKVAERVVDIAQGTPFSSSDLTVVEALIDPVCASSTPRRDPHQVSSRSLITGYLGILAFVVVLAPIVALIYFILHPGSLVSQVVVLSPSQIGQWVEGIVPNIAIGLWYAAFLNLATHLLPPDLGRGPPLPLPGGEKSSTNGLVSWMRMAGLV